MTSIVYAFQGFPLFVSRRPIMTGGQVHCKATHIAPSGAGEVGAVQWQATQIDLDIGKKGKQTINLNQDEWLRQDFLCWLRGHHGPEIERRLRQTARSKETDTP